MHALRYGHCMAVMVISMGRSNDGFTKGINIK